MLPAGDSGGFLLSLVTESFAVRALLGSLAAAGLAAALVGFGAVRTSRARRLVLLAPVLTAAAAAVASVGEVYLPQLWVATDALAGGATAVELWGEHLGMVTQRGVDALVLAYALVAVLLLLRRAAGLLSTARVLRRAVDVPPGSTVAHESARLAATLHIRTPRVVLLEHCPGGAFTTGSLRPVIAVDRALVAQLDTYELEGLLAHELAHIARRDTLLGAVVGVFRDLAFFLPPLHLAVRWLRREQEESADELASAHTGRPVALASSILKVWTSRCEHESLAGVCAAVPGRVALPSSVLVGGARFGDPLKVITARVERLIARAPAPSRLRRYTEVALASAVLAAATTAALTLPQWIATDLNADSLSFVYLSSPPSAPVESPAFSTFRALTRTSQEPATASGSSTDAVSPAIAGIPRGCPCVESQAQLLRGEAAVGQRAPRRLAWGSGRPAWDMSVPFSDVAVRTARPLVMIGESGPQVGFFLVGQPGR